MGKNHTSLGDVILAAFKRACDDGDLQVAEHLLRALEVMTDRAGGEERVERAYLRIACSPVNNERH